MTLEEFRESVYATFGSRLEHVTPDLMRDFISRTYAHLSPPARNDIGTGDGAIVIPTEGPSSYEEIVTNFFARMLNCPPDQAVILLWLFAGEMYFSDLGERYSEDFQHLLPPTNL